MAYDKHTWTCDEPITVERLNHIEDGIANAGGGDCGFECEEGMVTLTEESVTTELDGDAAYGDLSYSQLIDAESIKVTFNGTVYECEGVEGDHGYTYGASYDFNLDAWDWSEYPFQISSHETPFGIGNSFATSTAGTYSIKIEIEEEIVTTTPCFDKARGYSCDEEMGVLTEESVTTTSQGETNHGQLSYSQFIDAEVIKVTFNGVEYDCPRIATNAINAYGGFNPTTGDPDFSQYPFAIVSTSIINFLDTETAGTYSVKIEGMQEVATTTQCFEKAVQSAASPLVVEATLSPGEATSQSPSHLNAPIKKITEAMITRGVVVRDPHGILYSVLSVTDATVTIAIGVYNSTTQQTDFSAFCYVVQWDGLQYPQIGIQ